MFGLQCCFREVVHCYLVGVSMCLIHQDVLFAPRYEFLSVSS